jgi:hypothetical protein
MDEYFLNSFKVKHIFEKRNAFVGFLPGFIYNNKVSHPQSPPLTLFG